MVSSGPVYGIEGRVRQFIALLKVNFSEDMGKYRYRHIGISIIV